MSSKEVYTNSVLYSYLIKKDPKCAELFLKNNKVQRLPPGTPSLEEFIQKASLKAAPKGGTLVNNQVGQDSSSESSSESEAERCVQKQNVTTHIPLSKQSSSSDSSDSSDLENKKKCITAKKNASNFVVKNTLASKKADSSSSSDSDEEPLKPVAKQNPIQNVKKNSFQKTKDSSSSSDDSDDAKIPLSQNSKTLASKVQISKITQGKTPAKKSSSSSDDSSSESAKVSLAKKTSTPMGPTKGMQSPGNLNAATSSLLASKKADSSSSSDSDEEPLKPVAKQNPIQNVKKNQFQKTKDSSSSSDDSDDARIPLSQNSKTLASKVQISKITQGKTPAKKSSSSSDDSSSESGKKAQQPKIIVPNKTDNWTSVISKFVAQFSSDSESDERHVKVSLAKKTSTPMGPTKGVQSPGNLNAATSSLKKKQTNSSDDSSSESESEQSEGATKRLGNNVKNVSMTGCGMNKSPASVKPTQKKNESSDDSSDSEDGRIMSKLPPPPKQICKKDSSSDSSDSDEGNVTLKNSAVSRNQVKQSNIQSKAAVIKPLAKSPAKTSSLVAATKKVSDSSSDSSDDTSSSEDETSQPLKKSVSKVTMIKPLGQNQGSSSDSSNSDEENGTAMNVKQNILKRPNQINLTSNKKLPFSQSKTSPFLAGKSVITNKQDESSSDSSSESESQPHKSHASVAANSVSSKGSIMENTRAPKRKKQSSDSEEESRSTNSDIAAGDAQPFSKKQRMEQQLFANNQNQTFNNQFGGISPAASDNTRKHRGSSPFRRIKDDNSYVDPRLQKSAQLAKQSLPSFQGVRGKQFRHEKTKKKRMAHPGKVDTSVKSIPFND